MSAGRRRFVFSMEQAEADALIALVENLSPWLKRGSALDRATIKMDEQKAKQDAPWERCKACKGSGWVESL